MQVLDCLSQIMSFVFLHWLLVMGVVMQVLDFLFHFMPSAQCALGFGELAAEAAIGTETATIVAETAMPVRNLENIQMPPFLDISVNIKERRL
jgi:hypothetical protein